MNRQFTEFRSVEATGTTAMMAIERDGSTVLLSRDWATISEDGQHAQWEDVVEALLPSAIEGVESPDDSVSIDLTTAIEHITDSDLIDDTDGRGDHRAQALVEYLIESDIFNSSDDDVVLLKRFGYDEDDDISSLLTTAAISNYYQSLVNDAKEKISHPKNNNDVKNVKSENVNPETIANVIKCHESIDIGELGKDVDRTNDILSESSHYFDQIEDVMRVTAALRNTHLDDIESMRSNLIDFARSVGEMEAETKKAHEALDEVSVEDVYGSTGENVDHTSESLENKEDPSESKDIIGSSSSPDGSDETE